MYTIKDKIMKLRKLFITLMALCAGIGNMKADEGMWMITNLSARTDSVLHAMGLQLSHDEIFSLDHPALNNAIVQFGGFCSGSIVSPDGLVFTNHHCGFGSIQSHATTKHDYLTDGFVAKKQKDELPNEGLYVDLHLNTYEVTDRMWSAVKPGMDLHQRALAMDSVAQKLQDELSDEHNFIHAEVVPYYKGSKYYVSIYQRFNDVRLVFAPPQCLGKHGGDTDNWMWPRQTCDFSVFRIYANRQNKPAEYSKDNVPYHPVRYAHISTQGYQPGSFCMTFGYPGSTDRYLSSYGIDNTMRTTNTLREEVRGVKLGILKEAMNASDKIRIMYASKYAASSNYWKFSIGQNKALRELGVIAEKEALEKEVEQWAKAEGKTEYSGLLDSLKNAYAAHFTQSFARTLWIESFYSGSDIMQFAVKRLLGGEVDNFKKQVEDTYKDVDIETDQKVFTALVKNYAKEVPDTAYLPSFYKTINERFGGDYEAWAKDLYAHSRFADPTELVMANEDSLKKDPMMDVTLEAIVTLYKTAAQSKTKEYERLLGNAIREMNKDKEYYPDANFTLRMSFGIVEGYNDYTCFTPSKSILDKYEQHASNPDYNLTKPVYEWLKKGDFGKQYIDARSGDLQLCFLTNNDITGGNSGSGMYDAKGRLIGLAFDGNWEAMSGDLKFDNNLQRCIGVDIRYVLSVIEKYGKSKRLINELTLE